jgi:hypothetical protein
MIVLGRFGNGRLQREEQQRRDGVANERSLAKYRARKKREDRLATVDYVTLADGQVMAVPRASLAAAKELLAAQKAAERRVSLRQGNFSQRPLTDTE